MARLEQSFSRTFTGAHLAGRHAEVRSGGRGGHRGVPVGRVVKVDEDTGRVEFRLTRPLDAGDVVCVYTSRGQTGPVTVATAGRESLSLVLREQVSPKDRLFRLSAARDDESARELVSGRAVVRPIPLRARLRARVGAPAHLRLDCHDFTAETESSADADPARAAPLTGGAVPAGLRAQGHAPPCAGGHRRRTSGRTAARGPVACPCAHRGAGGRTSIPSRRRASRRPRCGTPSESRGVTAPGSGR